MQIFQNAWTGLNLKIAYFLKSTIISQTKIHEISEIVNIKTTPWVIAGFGN